MSPTLVLVLGLIATSGSLGFLVVWARRRFAWARSDRARWLLPTIAILLFAIPVFTRYFGRVTPTSWMWVHGVAMLFAGMAMFAAPVVLVWEIFVRFALRPKPEEPASLARREAIASIGGGVLATGVAGTLGFGALKTRLDVDVTEVPVRIARLPKALDGFSIVQVSDIHVGPFFGERDLVRAEDMVRGLRPDLVVMTGDLVHLHAGYLPMSVAWVARLGAMARHGAAAIPGNHEYYVGREKVLGALQNAGVDVLLNRGRVVAKADGGGFGLVGVDDIYGSLSGRGPGPRVERPLAELSPDLARVLLCHQPHWHPHAASFGFDLMLSGHLHGGQIAPLGPLVAGAVYDAVAGLYDRAGCRLYVNRGLGTSGVPSRVAVRPEITKIVLVAG